MRRKIVRVGASLCVLLPKSVITAMDWDFGDYIDLILDEEEEQVILRNYVVKKVSKSTYFERFDGFMQEFKDTLQEIDEIA